jgi:hypothetical protein
VKVVISMRIEPVIAKSIKLKKMDTPSFALSVSKISSDPKYQMQ